MNKIRHLEIDILRGISMLVMILIHTNAYFLSNRIAFLSWDIGEFAVPVFIFCSAYIFFKREFTLTAKNAFSYFKKRLNRLIVPYYLFSLMYILLIWFSQPKKITPKFLLGNLTFTDGMGINWLVILFLIFVFIMPLLYYLKKKSLLLLYLFSGLSIVSSIIFMFYKPPIAYQFTNWLPWSLIIVFVIYFVRYQEKKWFFPATIIFSLILFLVLRQILVFNHHSLIQYDNKYPPNLYHLIYGVFSIALLYYLSLKGVFNFSPLKKLIIFLSKYSYTIFFIHYLVIFSLTAILKLKFNWISFFLTVFFLSISIQWSYNKISSRLSFFHVK